MNFDRSIIGDGIEYDILYESANKIKGVPGLTCDIGLRMGMSSKIIMDGLSENNEKWRTHIAIDPYGNIIYHMRDDYHVKMDYTNDMKNECLTYMHRHSYETGINFLFFNMEDTEFFKRYSNGVPVYMEEKSIINIYALIFFDGPHGLSDVKIEIDFFMNKLSVGGHFVFDNIVDYYDHSIIEDILLRNNFILYKRGNQKASYVKIRNF